MDVPDSKSNNDLISEATLYHVANYMAKPNKLLNLLPSLPKYRNERKKFVDSAKVFYLHDPNMLHFWYVIQSYNKEPFRLDLGLELFEIINREYEGQKKVFFNFGRYLVDLSTKREYPSLTSGLYHPNKKHYWIVSRDGSHIINFTVSGYTNKDIIIGYYSNLDEAIKEIHFSENKGDIQWKPHSFIINDMETVAWFHQNEKQYVLRTYSLNSLIEGINAQHLPAPYDYPIDNSIGEDVLKGQEKKIFTFFLDNQFVLAEMRIMSENVKISFSRVLPLYSEDKKVLKYEKMDFLPTLTFSLDRYLFNKGAWSIHDVTLTKFDGIYYLYLRPLLYFGGAFTYDLESNNWNVVEEQLIGVLEYPESVEQVRVFDSEKGKLISRIKFDSHVFLT